MVLQKDWIIYIVKFLVIFSILYFGTEAVIGIQAPGGSYYSPFVEKYLNYVQWLRSGIMYATQLMMQLLGYTVTRPDFHTIRIVNANAISIDTGCLGYGVMCCWIAFIFANRGSKKLKLTWLFAGLLLIQFCNVIRVTLILVSNYKGWPTFRKMDHHDFFNYMSYAVIIFLIWHYQKKVNAEEDSLEQEAV